MERKSPANNSGKHAKKKKPAPILTQSVAVPNSPGAIPSPFLRAGIGRDHAAPSTDRAGRRRDTENTAVVTVDNGNGRGQPAGASTTPTAVATPATAVFAPVGGFPFAPGATTPVGLPVGSSVAEAEAERVVIDLTKSPVSPTPKTVIDLTKSPTPEVNPTSKTADALKGPTPETKRADRMRKKADAFKAALDSQAKKPDDPFKKADTPKAKKATPKKKASPAKAGPPRDEKAPEPPKPSPCEVVQVTPAKRSRYKKPYRDPSYYSDDKKSYQSFSSSSDSSESDFTHHQSDYEDDPVAFEREWGLRDEDDSDEYAKHYDGDDKYPKKRRF